MESPDESPKIYHYDPSTGAYLSASNAVRGQGVPGGVLLPAWATLVAPPVTGEREAARFDPATEAWLVVPDYRGMTLYSTADGHEIKIDKLGVQPQDLPDTTAGPRPTVDHTWNGNAWIVTPETARIVLSREIDAAARARLHDFAQAREYDNIEALCSYAASNNERFAADALIGVAARDAVWEAVIDLLNAVDTGARELPTLADALQELPALSWPVAD